MYDLNMDKKLVARYIIRECLGVAVMAAALFVPAKRLDWWQAWAAVGIMSAWVIATALVILRFHPALLAERLGPRRGAKRWDTAIMSLLGLTQLARYILAGLDQRYGWSGAFPLNVQIAALVFGAAGYALVVWATASNAFFSQIVRLQSERGQQVVMKGPYHWVRHPAYAGAILFEIAVPLALGSWPALWVSLLNVMLLILRTALEDRALRAELNGYAEYADQVRYRLLPGLW
jgi:protein-S-isoprenylcysteine O-methyltransferase Ste14